jgi:hypothetical protein
LSGVDRPPFRDYLTNSRAHVPYLPRVLEAPPRPLWDTVLCFTSRLAQKFRKYN